MDEEQETSHGKVSIYITQGLGIVYIVQQKKSREGVREIDLK